MVELYTRCRGVLLTYYRNITTSMKRGYPGAESSMDKLMSSELTKDLFEFAVSIQGIRVFYGKKMHWPILFGN